MPLLLIVLFVVVPLVELAVIQQVAQAISLGPTLVLLLLDSVLGAVLVRREGSRAWAAFREALSEGRIPGDEIVQGALVLGGGALLLTPGFVTDVVGLLLVVPASRRLLSKGIRTRVVPVPLQVGGSLFDRARQAGQDPRGASGTSGPAVGGGGAPPVEDVEVLSVEREQQDDDSG